MMFRGKPWARLGIVMLALAFFTTFATAQEETTQRAIGGTTMSAGIADSQAQLDQAMGATTGLGGDSIGAYASAYRASAGGPALQLLGFNPFEFLASGAFHTLYWSAILVFLGVMGVKATMQALGGRHPIEGLARVYFRLFVGVLVIANTPFLYACVMTLNGSLTQGVQLMNERSTEVRNTLQAGSMGTLTMAQARLEAIRSAAARRAVALYPSGASRDEMVQIGEWYNAMANAINPALEAADLSGELPVLDSAVWSNAATPDAQVAAYVGRNVVRNFGQLVANLASLPADGADLTIVFPAGGGSPLLLLSKALAADDAEAAKAVALPNTPANSAAFESARQLYSKRVHTHTLDYLDSQLLSVIGASPTLAQRVKAWFSEKVEQAAAAAAGFLKNVRDFVDMVGRSIGGALTRIVAFVFTAGMRVMLELNLFVLVIALPFWLLPTTENAFYGVLRSLVSFSVVVPVYQFLMLFVDALMGLALRYLILGPLAVSSGGAGQSISGVAYMIAAAASGELIVLVTICYVLTYVFLAIYMAIKTPKFITLFLKGAGAAGAFVMAMATGALAGVATTVISAALATGGAAGGGIAARLLGAGAAARAGTSPVPTTRVSMGPPLGRPVVATTTAPSTPAPAGMPRPPLGRVVSTSVEPPPPPPRVEAPPVAAPAPRRVPAPRVVRGYHVAEAFSYGIRTFVDALAAESPGQGFRIAVENLNRHLYRQERDEERVYRALVREEAMRRRQYA